MQKKFILLLIFSIFLFNSCGYKFKVDKNIRDPIRLAEATEANTKLSDLPELATTPAASDELYINDGGVSKKIQYSNLGIGGGEVSISGTPNADEIAVWTDASTIKGDATPDIGTPSAGVLTNCTGLPITTGVFAGNWKVFYSNGSGVLTELALGADGTYVMSNGAAVAPSFETPGGSGDVTAVGDCASGDCYDGSSDGGTYTRLYDGDSHYLQWTVEDISADYILSPPPTIGTSGQLMQSDADNTTSWTSSLSLAFRDTVPEALFRDSGAAGAADEDENAGSIKANMSTTTEDAEVSDLYFTVIGSATAGTEYVWGWFDSSDAAAYFGVMTDNLTPADVAGYEKIKFDFNTGNDGEVAISIPDSGYLTLPVDTVDYLAGTGSSKSLTPVTDDADNFAANFTGANLYGGTFIANAAGTAQLPAITAGMNFTIITLGAVAVVVEPNASDNFLADGVQLDDADSLTNLSTAGDIAVFQYYSAAGWVASTNGWTDED